MSKQTKLTCKELAPKLWRDFEKLFGANGACGGCWCMSWRVEKGESWDEMKGAEAKARMRSMILAGEAHGVLAYADGEPVGWASLGKRREYPKLDRSPSLKCDDADDVWSIPCFYVKTGFRGQGVASALLAEARKVVKKHGGKILEGYPVKPQKATGKIPAAFAWTGTRPLFAKAGFKIVGNRDGGKQRVRADV